MNMLYWILYFCPYLFLLRFAALFNLFFQVIYVRLLWCSYLYLYDFWAIYEFQNVDLEFIICLIKALYYQQNIFFKKNEFLFMNLYYKIYLYSTIIFIV